MSLVYCDLFEVDPSETSIVEGEEDESSDKGDPSLVEVVSLFLVESPSLPGWYRR